MGWIEYLLIVAGSSLEIFVAMECQGSLIQKVNKKQLTAICFIVAVCQLLAMYIGYFLSSFLNGKYSVKDEALLGEIISIGILIGLGIRLIGKAIRNERIEEHCQAQLDMKRVLRIAGITAFYTVLNWLGWKDLNPRNGGVRVRCLTTWRHPNIRFCCYCRDNVDYYITTKP